MSDLYREIIIDEFQHPHNYGGMADADVKQHGRNSSCGDEITVYLKLDKTKQKIVDLQWIGEGCAISQAAASLLSVELYNKTLAEVSQMTKHDLEQLLGIDEITYGREKCLLLGLETIQKAVNQVQSHHDSKK